MLSLVGVNEERDAHGNKDRNKCHRQKDKDTGDGENTLPSRSCCMDSLDSAAKPEALKTATSETDTQA